MGTVRIKMLTSIADDRVEYIMNDELGVPEAFLELDEATAKRYVETGQAEYAAKSKRSSARAAAAEPSAEAPAAKPAARKRTSKRPAAKR